MTIRYVAFGLELKASFPLPGMARERTTGLPSLEIHKAAPGELEANWSGADGLPLWRGRLGDGRYLTIERGTASDLLYSYNDHARFWLDADRHTLACTPLRSGLDWQRVLIGKVLSSISVVRGYEALHAAVIDSPAGVVAITGPSGAGKSTLATELLGRGWPLFADDVLVLGRFGDAVFAYPGTPHMSLAANLPSTVDPEAVGRTIGMLGDERWLAAKTTTTHPRPIQMVCMLERRRGLALEARRLASNPLTLAPYMLGLFVDVERERARFGIYADLMECTTLLRLTAAPEHGPAQLADLLERSLSSPSGSVVVGAA